MSSTGAQAPLLKLHSLRLAETGVADAAVLIDPVDTRVGSLADVAGSNLDFRPDPKSGH